MPLYSRLLPPLPASQPLTMHPQAQVQPQIIILKEGTDTSQGKPQLLSNINAIAAVVNTVKTTLGPRGMDKLIVDARGKTTISNDGATIMKLLEIIHPAAKLLVEIARSQDLEVGDGTTSVVLLAGELLNQVRPLIEDNVNPQSIIKGFRSACEIARKRIQELAVDTRTLGEDWRSVLERCASTSMNSKIICHQKEFFKRMVVDAVLSLDQCSLNERMIGIKKVPGGALQDSMLVMGVAFKRTFHYAGFEQQPRKIENPRILCLNLELELKAERANAEVRVSQVQEYQAVVDAEWAIIYEKLDKIAASGANVVLSRLPIGDLATQYFADRGIFCAGRVPSEDLERVTLAVGGAIQSSVNDLTTEQGNLLGTCGSFEEVQIGAERYNLFTECAQAKTCTMILRGGSEQFISEVERSLHDAVMITKRAIRFPTIVAGGGALEMEISRSLKEYANSIEGKQQLVISAFAKAFEIIPRQLSDNCGLDTPAVMNKLRRKHAVDGAIWAGVDITSASGVGNNFDKFVWEPALVKSNMVSAATEAAVMILSVDETVKAPVPEDKNGGPAGFR